MSRRAAQRYGHGKNLVGFLVGGARYAVEIHAVREVIQPLQVVALAHAPPVVAGVAEHRGEIVPVIALRRRFGLVEVEPTRKTKWVVVRAGKRNAALVVDEVTDVFGVDPNARLAVPELGVGDVARGFGAAFAHEGTIVFVLDVERVAAAADAIDLVAAPRVFGDHPSR